MDSDCLLFNEYMGKLRFTLTYVVFWIIIVFSCLLAENFALLSSDHMGGMSVDTVLLLSLFVIFLLVFYYFREHKKNGLTFDKILLPIIAIFGLVSIITIWWQGDRTFVNPDDGFTSTIAFTIKEKFSFSLQVVIWCAVLYGLLFVTNRYSISRKWLKWLAMVYVFGVLACSFIDIGMELQSIIDIFFSTYEGPGLQFVIYNANVWGHILLVGLLSCIVLNVKKFNLFYYLAMIHLFIMIIFTTCSTAVFVGLTAIIVYTLFEIFSLLKKQLKRSLTLLIVYLGSLLLFFSLFALMAALNVPVFSNFWSYVSREILQKDYSTLTSRTGIWASLLKLLSANPRDIIFGLGYKTGNAIFSQYFFVFNNHVFTLRSAHNGVLEIFLRHGVFGLFFYVAMFVVFVSGIVKLFKKRQYRSAYFYIICVAGILVHGIAESTMFFTPNIAGTYMTFIFFLPIVNVTKEEHFVALNKDLQCEPLDDVKLEKYSLYYFINVMVVGFLCALLSTLPIRYIYTDMGALITYIVLISLTIYGLFITPLIASLILKVSYKEAFLETLIKPFKNNFVVIFVSLGTGLLLGFLLQLIFSYDLFAVILFTLFVFILYNFVFSLISKEDDALMMRYFDKQFTTLLRFVSSEVDYEQD